MKHVITIPGQTISKKNSKQIVITGNGKRRVISSENYQTWEQAALWSLKSCEYRGFKWNYPILVRFHFVRKDKRIFDFNNLAQGPMDVLQQAGVIESDDMNHVIPAGFSWSVGDEPKVVIEMEEIYERTNTVTP